MTSPEKHIATLVGRSLSGKTTEMRALVELAGFDPLTNLTNRHPRTSDLPGEYDYLTAYELSRLDKANQLLWLITAGHGNYYAKERSVVEAALLSPADRRVNALTPDTANIFAEFAGPEHAATFWLPTPPIDEVRRRALIRGDSADQIEKRLAGESDWEEKALAIKGIHVITGTTPQEIHHEILDVMGIAA